MTEEEIQQEFKELNKHLSYLCTVGHDVKDAGNGWIAFTDKFSRFEKNLTESIPSEETIIEDAEREYPVLGGNCGKSALDNAINDKCREAYIKAAKKYSK